MDVRTATVNCLRSNKDHFIGFWGGEDLRRSKRKTSGPSTVVVDHGRATDEARMADFDRHLASMGRAGVWGDHLEAAGCAHAFGVDVKIYHETFTPEVMAGGEEGDNRPTVRVAFHEWRHYSSVRQVNEEHAGVANTVASPSPAAIPLPPSPAGSRASTPGSESIGREDEDDDIDNQASRKKARSSSPAPADKPKRQIKRAVSPKKGSMSRKPAPEVSVSEEKANSPVDCPSAPSSAAAPAPLSGSPGAPALSGSTSAAVDKSTTAKDAAAAEDSAYDESDISSVLSDPATRRRLSQRASRTTTRGRSSAAKTNKKSESGSEWSESDAKVTKRSGRVGGKGKGSKTKGEQTKAKQTGPKAKASATPRSSAKKGSKKGVKKTVEVVADVEVVEEEEEAKEKGVAKKGVKKGRKQ